MPRKAKNRTMNKLRSIVLTLKNSETFKKIILWAIVIFLFLYVFSIPSFSAKKVLNYISYVFVAGIIGCSFLYTFLYLKFPKNKFFVLPLILVAIGFIGTSIYLHNFDSYRRWLTLLLMTLTMYAIYLSFLIIDNPRFIMKIIIFAFLAFSIYFAIVYRKYILSFNISADLRFEIYFDNVNTLGFYFSILFVMAFYIALTFKKKRELLYCLAALVFFGLGLFTASRSFILVSVGGAIGVLFLRFKQKKLIFLIVLVALIVLLVILINSVPFLKDQFDRMLFTVFGIGNSKVDGSTLQRTVWANYAFTLGSENILFGYGVDGFANISGIGTYAHNNFAEMICDFGIFGIITYYLMFVVLGAKAFRSKDTNVNFVAVLLFIYFIRSFFGVLYYTKDSYLIFALCLYLTKDIEGIIGYREKKLKLNDCYDVYI